MKLSNGDGKVHGGLSSGRGVLDFIPYLKEFKGLGLDGAIRSERADSPEPEEIVDRVREAYEKTAQLLRQAGLRS